jgi:hypothetical protein
LMPVKLMMCLMQCSCKFFLTTIENWQSSEECNVKGVSETPKTWDSITPELPNTLCKQFRDDENLCLWNLRANMQRRLTLRSHPWNDLDSKHFHEKEVKACFTPSHVSWHMSTDFSNSANILQIILVCFDDVISAFRSDWG